MVAREAEPVDLIGRHCKTEPRAIKAREMSDIGR